MCKNLRLNFKNIEINGYNVLKIDKSRIQKNTNQHVAARRSAEDGRINCDKFWSRNGSDRNQFLMLLLMVMMIFIVGRGILRIFFQMVLVCFQRRKSANSWTLEYIDVEYMHWLRFKKYFSWYTSTSATTKLYIWGWVGSSTRFLKRDYWDILRFLSEWELNQISSFIQIC